MKRLDIFHLGEQALVLGVPAIGIRTVEQPLEVGNKPELREAAGKIFDGNRPKLHRIVCSRQSDLYRCANAAVGADNCQSMLVWRDRERINMLLGKIADQRPRAARLTGFDRSIDEKDCPSGRVEQVIRSAA